MSFNTSAIVVFKTAKLFSVFLEQKKVVVKAFLYKKQLEYHPILVGDRVEVIQIEDAFYIKKIYQRQNYLIRPKVANLDCLILVLSATHPSFSLFNLNQFLVNFESQRVKKIIFYITKLDLLTASEINEIDQILDPYKVNNYEVFYSLNKAEFKKHLISNYESKLICFAGQSGVGKSSFINYFDETIKQKTQNVSINLQRGKNTTTNPQIFYSHGLFIVDNPGFDKLFVPQKKADLAISYNDFYEYGIKCYFSNCLHLEEKDCYIKQLLEQKKIAYAKYEHYLKLLKTLKI